MPFAASPHARHGRARPSQGQERRQARRTSTGNVVEPQSPHTAASLPAIDASVAAAMGIPPELVGMLLADPDVAAAFQVRACVLRGTWHGCGNSPLSCCVLFGVRAETERDVVANEGMGARGSTRALSLPPVTRCVLRQILQEPECAAAELAKDAEVAAVYKKLMQHVGMADGEGDEFTGLHDDADMGSDEDAMDDL